MSNNLNISPKKQILIVYIFLAAITLAVYWQVNKFDFVNLDDDVYVTINHHIQSGITSDGIRWAFTTTYAEFWHPLTWLSLMLDYQFYGLNAGGYHVTNLILHILSTLLLFWLFNRMTGAVWKSAFVAALFALHPLHVESVAWVSERKDVLSAFFWMLTLCLYVYYVEKPAVRRYLLVLFSFVLALMSKPMVVTLPVIMILLDFWPLKRFESQKDNLLLWQIKEKLPLFFLSAVFSVITIYAQPKLPIKGWPLSLDSRIINALVSFVIYLEKTFLPHNLSVWYPFYGQVPLWQVWGSVLLIILVTASVIVVVKWFPYLFVGWFWYAITLMPAMGIIPMGNNSMADRYVYLPSIGICIMLAWGIPLLIKSENIRRKILFPAGVILIAVLSFLTWQQCGYWKNSIELSSNAMRVTKNNYLVHGHLGFALFVQGEIKEAIDHYDKAIKMAPDYVAVYNARAVAYTRLGQYQKAIEDYNMAIRLKPDYVDAFNNRGSTYDRLGQYQKAIEDYNMAIRLKPDYVDAYYNRGIVYTKLNNYFMAVENYNKVIRLNPNETYAYLNRAKIYFKEGKIKPGCSDAQKSCELGNCTILEIAIDRGYCR